MTFYSFNYFQNGGGIITIYIQNSDFSEFLSQKHIFFFLWILSLYPTILCIYLLRLYHKSDIYLYILSLYIRILTFPESQFLVYVLSLYLNKYIQNCENLKVKQKVWIMKSLNCEINNHIGKI